MADIAIVGAGHVGVTYAAGLAALGHRIRVLDIDGARLAKLRRGKLWFFEPGLAELLTRGIARRRISFTTRYRIALKGVQFVFVCVSTPTTPDGSLDDSSIRSAFDQIKAHAGNPPPIVINKSTVPVGTGDAALQIFAQTDIKVVSNPEFLSEGRAVEDFFRPNRILIGSRDREAARLVANLFRPLHRRIVLTDSATAEVAKLASNAFLATKISFANAFARIAEEVGADVDELSRTLSLDPRIGPGHLTVGLGFGGSCLPKDIAAVEQLARRFGASYELFAAVATINREQRRRIIDFLLKTWGAIAGRRIGVLGLSFKPNTDDTRESPAVALVEELVAHRADVCVYDPAVRSAVRGATTVRTALAAARRADALIVATDWPEFRSLDLARLNGTMRGNVLIDARGVWDAARARELGFTYYSYGRGGSPRGTS